MRSPMLAIRRLEKWSTAERPRGRACCATWSIARGWRVRFPYLPDNQTRSTRTTRFITRRPALHRPGNHRLFPDLQLTLRAGRGGLEYNSRNPKLFPSKDVALDDRVRSLWLVRAAATRSHRTCSLVARRIHGQGCAGL